MYQVSGLPEHLLPRPPKRTSPSFEKLKKALSRSPSPVTAGRMSPLNFINRPVSPLVAPMPDSKQTSLSILFDALLLSRSLIYLGSAIDDLTTACLQPLRSSLILKVPFVFCAVHSLMFPSHFSLCLPPSILPWTDWGRVGTISRVLLTWGRKSKSETYLKADSMILSVVLSPEE